MTNKLRTNEELKAMKNVDHANAKVDEGSQTLGEHEAIVFLDNGKWRWNFYVGDDVITTTKSCPTQDEARKDCMKIMGIAWNFAVKTKES